MARRLERPTLVRHRKARPNAEVRRPESGIPAKRLYAAHEWAQPTCGRLHPAAMRDTRPTRQGVRVSVSSRIPRTVMGGVRI